MGGSLDSEPIAIAYCGDQGLFEAFLLSSLSVAKTTARPLHFYFLTGTIATPKFSFGPLTQSQGEFIGEILRRHNPKVTTEVLDCTAIYEKELSASVNVNTFYSPYSLFRLVMDFLPLPDKLLYLDADTIALKDLGSLFDSDLSPFDLGMALDAVGHRFLGPHYGNSGVLLLNLSAIKSDGLMGQARKIVNRFRMFMPDQTTLNLVFRKKKLLLAEKFNEQIALTPETVIRHYCKRLRWLPYIHTVNVKPWNIEAFRKHFGNLHQDLLEEFSAILKEYSATPR
jgi:lipopolysaccharide biosynthesis glycosyltransferase